MSQKKAGKKRAVFLDRDGTINHEVSLLHKLKDFRVMPGVANAIRKMNKLGFVMIVITNQGGPISRTSLTEEKLDRIHAVMVRRLRRNGAKLHAIYYCPHHTESKKEKYRMTCQCRKPNPGMIIQAAKHYGIDLKNSFMIGDRTVDIVAGRRARVKTILVETGAAGKDGNHNVRPDFVAKNLQGAVRIIKEHGQKN